MSENLEMAAGRGAEPASEVLFARFAGQRDRAALEELVARWHAPAFRVARCICHNETLAEEAVQDAFMKLLTGPARFVDRGPGSFRSWFLCLVTNSARMARRCERRAEARKHVDLPTYLRRKHLDAAPLNSGVEPAEWRSLLERTLENLEERWRTPVQLHYLSGMQQKEVARALGVSQQMVSRRIEQGLEALRRRLAGRHVVCT